MKPGSLVICVDDKFRVGDASYFTSLPQLNKIYVVREIHDNKQVPNGPPGVSVEEITGSILEYTSYWGELLVAEAHFKIKRFVEILPPVDLEELIAQPEKVLAEVLA